MKNLKLKTREILFWVVVISLIPLAPVWAAEAASANEPPVQNGAFAPRVNPDADNTSVNARMHDRDSYTPLDQSNDPADVDITKKIRQAIVLDKALSMTAENIKVITRGGIVYLRGPVKNQMEKDNIVAKAIVIAGIGHVKDQLETKV